MTIKKGKVYLVGAGPGDPKLITVKGLECIRNADVVIYDNLASKELISKARPATKLIFVGKSQGKHTMEQEQINELLVEHAKQGLVVTRLKGGDNFIFGRGGEEAEYLFAHGIPFEIVPGITSAYGVPAYAGIPLTHRSMASSVTLLTGHEDSNKNQSSIDWSKVSTSTDTIVILMGVKNLATIVQNLLKNGRDPQTPVALIRWGTTPKQKTVIGTLENIVDKTHQEKIKPPVVTVIGGVVNLHKKLSWYEQKPLYGKRVIVTRAKDQAQKFVSKIEQLGGIAVEVPTIKIVEPDDLAPAEKAIRRIMSGKGFDWVIFTSANAVKAFAKLLSKHGQAMDMLKTAKIAVIGKSTALTVKEYGLVPAFMPKNYVAESAVEGFLQVAQEKESVLIPRAQVARDVIPDALRKHGLDVFIAPVYKNVPEQEISEATLKELIENGADYITLTSSSTAKNFFSLIEKYKLWDALKKSKIVSIGPITTATIKDLGYMVDVEAREYTTDGLIEVMILAGN